MDPNFHGLIVGAAAFFLIGIFHPIVVKAEYYFSKKCWFVFLLVGLTALLISTQMSGSIASSLAAVFGISCLWSIKELFEQERRVEKGWFPSNPRRRRE